MGDDAIVHGINETEATLVITSHDLLPKLKVSIKTIACKTSENIENIFMKLLLENYHNKIHSKNNPEKIFHGILKPQ